MPARPVSDEACADAYRVWLANERNYVKGAAAAGIERVTFMRYVKKAMARLEADDTYAARMGFAPGHFDSGVAPGYRMGKVTVQRNAQGDVERTWERQHPAADLLEDIERKIDERLERVTPLPPAPMPANFGPVDLLNQVTIADGHVGALAWHRETGSDDWDLNIAKAQLLGGACWLMDNLPAAETLLLNILGDFTDTDGYVPVTPASKHILDVDGRFPKITDAAEETIERAVLHGLTRYKRVILVIMPGNHDPNTAMWMRKLFKRIFLNEPRVHVETSLRPYWAMLHGKTMVTAHHGDKAKLGELPGIFAADFAPMWGQATYRICHTGHYHHKHFIVHSGRELMGMMVYQHPTLASRNAWAADKGLSAARELLGHSYHTAGAMVTTLHFSPDLLGSSLGEAVQ